MKSKNFKNEMAVTSEFGINVKAQNNYYPKEKIEAFYKEHLQSFNLGASKVIEHIDESAIIEYPYYGVTPIKMNRKEYFAQLSNILPAMGKFTFKNFVIYATDEPNTYWSMAQGECIIASTGKLFQQDYVVRFSINKNMEITHYVEYGNPLKMQAALTK